MPEWTPFPGFCGQAYTLRSENLAIDESINVYPSSNQVGAGKGPVSLIARPGNVLFAATPVGSSSGRALWGGEGRMFAVVGSNAYEVNSGGTWTLLGAGGEVGGGSAPVQLLFNGTQLLMVNPNGQLAKVWTGSAWVVPPLWSASSPGWLPASQGAYLDGYGYILEANSNRVYQGTFLDFQPWSAINVGTRVSEQDRVLTIKSDHNFLWLIGTKTAEPWYNAGNATFALERVRNGFVESGTASAFSPASHAGAMFWLEASERGASRVVMVTPGQVRPISTQAVETAIGAYTPAQLSEAFGYCYDRQGHDFYVLSFPTVGVQWVYDITENAWHKRHAWTSYAGSKTMPPGYMHCVTFGNGHYVMDTVGNIYTQSETTFTDNGTAQYARRTAPLLVPGAKRLMVHGFRVDQQIGTGSATGAELSVSKDGGKTWSSPRTEDSLIDGMPEFRGLGRSTQKGMGVSVTWNTLNNLAVANAYLKADELGF